MSISLPGLASNLDTAGMISKLIELERIPYTNMESKKTNLAAEQNVFRTINTKLSALKTAISDLKLPSTYKQLSATNSDETVMKFTTKDNALAGSYNIEVLKLAKADSVTLDVNTMGSLSGKTLKIGTNAEITVASGLTDEEALKDLVKQINEQDNKVTATIISVNPDGTDKQLVLTSKETGLASTINLTGSVTDNQGTLTHQAQDAEIKVNGLLVKRSTNQISDVIDGATLNLFKEGTVAASISTDSTKVADKVEAFVTAYNELISIVRENLKPPLDDKKVNPLQGDSVLKSITDAAYRAVTDLIGSNGFMSDLGITIDKGVTKGSLMTGKITFDKEVFKTKLQEDPQNVIDLFSRPNAVDVNDPAGGRVKYDPQAGMAQRFDDLISTWNSVVNGSVTSKIKGYDSEISVVDERMERLSTRIDQKYERLKKQYTAMEVALTELNSQKSWMTSQLAALTASTQK
ncbi:MAG: flagellar filament capping protein FliD [Candidatus Pristimantibacillus sp.]